MTANEMKEEFLLKLDRLGSKRSKGYEDSEISILLTTSQWEYCTGILTNESKTLEETEITSHGFGNLIKPFSFTPSINSDSFNENSYLVELPSDFWLILSEKVVINKYLCGTEKYANLPVKPISHNEINQNEKNPYKKPYYNNDEGLVWRLVYNNNDTIQRLELISGDDFTITTYKAKYLIKPPSIVVDTETTTNQINCILNERQQIDIINLAVNLTKQITER